MLLNYLNFSLRILARNPFFTLINVFGLAIGIISFYCLWTYSASELKANQFFRDHDRIARVATHWTYRDNNQQWEKIDFGFSKSNLLQQIRQDQPEMESGVRILVPQGFDDFLVPHRQKLSFAVPNTGVDGIHRESKVIYADENLFQFLSIPLVMGDRNSLLKHPGSVALSESKAKLYFGSVDPLGQTLILNDSIPLQVTGVFSDLPYNTNFEFDIVITNEAYRSTWDTAMFGIVQNFIKLKPGISFDDFEKLINGQRWKYWSPFLNDTTKNNTSMFLQPLAEIPFEAREGDTYYERSSVVLTALRIIAVGILAMAWANYINLSIALAFKRIKEFETRKTNGARIFDLMTQCIIEAFIVNVLALLVAITILQLIQKPLHDEFYINILSPLDIEVEAILIFGGIFLFGILTTGIYPIAFSGLNKQPISVSKNGPAKKWNVMFPFTLSIFQFSSSIILILWAYIIFKELNFILNKDYGMDTDDVILVEAPIKKASDYLGDVQYLKTKLSSSPGVYKVTLSKFALGDYLSGGRGLRMSGSENTIGLDPNGVTEDYLDFYGLRLVAGRNFVKDDAPDKIIISRQATKRFGFKRPEDAIGAILETTSDYLNSNVFQPVEVIGVIEDFRTTDFLQAHAHRSDIDNEFASRGSVLTYLNSVYTDFLPERIELKIEPTELQSALQNIHDEYRKIFPLSPFTWHVLNDHLNQNYQHEKFSRNQIILYSVIAIGIASLGLLGNMAHTINVKTKEVSIRKILGAGTFQITMVLINSTIFQLAIAAVIGIPIAWLLGEQYMVRFSDKVPIAWWEYLIPLMFLMAILILSISAVLIRAAKRNPVDALKHE